MSRDRTRPGTERGLDTRLDTRTDYELDRLESGSDYHGRLCVSGFGGEPVIARGTWTPPPQSGSGHRRDFVVNDTPVEGTDPRDRFRNMRRPASSDGWAPPPLTGSGYRRDFVVNDVPAEGATPTERLKDIRRPAVPSGLSSSDLAQLGVDETATAKQIKAAYKRRLLRAHPDHGGTDDEFKQLREAYLRLMRSIGAKT